MAFHGDQMRLHGYKWINGAGWVHTERTSDWFVALGAPATFSTMYTGYGWLAYPLNRDRAEVLCEREIERRHRVREITDRSRGYAPVYRAADDPENFTRPNRATERLRAGKVIDENFKPSEWTA